MMESDPGAFLGLEGEDCRPDALGQVIPVPYEGTVTYGEGTAEGPAAILAASRQVEFHDEWLEDQARRFGVHCRPPVVWDGAPEDLAPRLEDLVGACLDAGQFPFLLGGEHSISLGPIRAAARRHPDLVVLQLDAHPDLREEYEGTRYGHGCVMRRALECGVHIHAFGLRAFSPEEIEFYAEGPRVSRVDARELLPLDPLAQVDRILRDLPSGPLWLSWDVDGLDPSIVQQTGTPEPGGIGWFVVSELLRRLDAEQRTLVGAELVELAPQSGQHAADFACARLAHRMLLAGLRSRARQH